MTEITRAEFDELRQKVEEIHRMLVNMGGQPNVVMVQPHPRPLWVDTPHIRTIPENEPRLEIAP